jgi:hypothetical protein
LRRRQAMRIIALVVEAIGAFAACRKRRGQRLMAK